MVSFGKKLRECREAKGYSQQELAKKSGSSYTVIGRYERNEMPPSIDVVRKLTNALETAVEYLLGDSEDRELLKDLSMLKRLNNISKFSEQDKYIFYALDAMINKVKFKAIQ